METAQDILKRYGIGSTPDRIGILNVFIQHRVAFSIVEIQQRAGLSCNKTTFYRNIEMLLEKDIIHKISDLDGTVRYSLSLADSLLSVHPTEHVHFRCLHCHTLTCLFQAVVQSPLLPAGYTITRTQVLVTGICEHCREAIHVLEDYTLN